MKCGIRVISFAAVAAGRKRDWDRERGREREEQEEEKEKRTEVSRQTRALAPAVYPSPPLRHPGFPSFVN